MFGEISPYLRGEFLRHFREITEACPLQGDFIQDALGELEKFLLSRQSVEEIEYRAFSLKEAEEIVARIRELRVAGTDSKPVLAIHLLIHRLDHRLVKEFLPL
jgi:hypothetical protein